MGEADDIIERRSRIMDESVRQYGRPVLPQPQTGCPRCGFAGMQLVRHPLFRDEARRVGVIAASYWVCLSRDRCGPFVRGEDGELREPD